MQHEVVKKVNLLDRRGHLTEEGWARRQNWMYDRRAIHAPFWRVKEWDYYAIVNQEKGYALTATISDLGYAALYAIAYIDYERKACAQDSAMTFFPRRLGFRGDSSSDQDLSWANRKMRIAFITRDGERHLLFASPSLVLPDGKVGIEADITVSQPSDLESMNIATSWKENRKAFYLNQKINCMGASGKIRRNTECEILREGEAWGTLDWGRGVWTYQNRWYWASASGLVEGVRFGFSVGYGFSDRSPASENVLFYDGKVHKLEEVTFHIPRDSFLKPWTFTSSDGRFDLAFEPRVDRSTNINALLVKSVQHQVFGFFTGVVKLDDGKEIRLVRFPGFAEDVFNRW